MRIFDAGYNRITDIKPLTGMKYLENLDIEFNRITDMTPLTAMSNLELLDIKYNRLTEIIPISGVYLYGFGNFGHIYNEEESLNEYLNEYQNCDI